ncbi:MAG: 4Fe-4S binding protein [Deltaproteobacteria bacterium]|jgi:2-oxoglutarate ferredoxin oxidoreductase subunit delta|nr:4Fe-4S binding protein [Deltaproteobacteria bacterium]
MEPIQINERWCKGCGICVAFCPAQALKLEDDKAKVVPGACKICGMCELYCPDLAITVNTDKNPGKISGKILGGA